MNATSHVLPKFSIGVGDRFAMEAEAQLRACEMAAAAGVDVIPVWNKSNREHLIVGSDPSETRAAADAAVRTLNWKKPYFLDADHITLQTVDRFLAPCDFFTIDVADWIGKPANSGDVQAFVSAHPELTGTVVVPGVAEPLSISRDFVSATAAKFFRAVQEAGRIYRHIEEKKGRGHFVPEISMDETDAPQRPAEMLIILAAIASEQIPIQTIAPKFTGRFNKGIDYVGDVATFAREISDDIAVIAFAIQQYGLPSNLKLSVHSGSDKFSIYRAIHHAIQRSGAGLHLKTAGTTWLEELIGLAEAGGDGLSAAKRIYNDAYAHSAELMGPYASVIDIDAARLPTPEDVTHWSSQQYVAALRHDRTNPQYNRDFRQLLHVGFKVAAKMGREYLDLLSAHRAVVAKNVTENLYTRHIQPVFVG